MSKEVQIIKYGNPLKGADDSVKLTNIELLMKVTAQAKNLAPVAKVNGGFLAGSIMWKVHNQKGGLTEGNDIEYEPKKGEGVVGSNAHYAIYQEFGTRKMESKPFLRPAIDMIVFGVSGAQAMKQSCIYAMTQALKAGKTYVWK